jgi:hypothetical protein
MHPDPIRITTAAAYREVQLYELLHKGGLDLLAEDMRQLGAAEVSRPPADRGGVVRPALRQVQPVALAELRTVGGKQLLERRCRVVLSTARVVITDEAAILERPCDPSTGTSASATLRPGSG